MAQVGNRVNVPHAGCEGTIRFVGSVHYAKGDWVGIELDQPNGKNNGTVKGQTYFQCDDKYGIFARPDSISVIGSEIKISNLGQSSNMGDGEAEKLEGNEHFAKKRYMKAYDCYSRAIEKCDTNHIFFSNRAACSLELGQAEDAIEDCEMALEINPSWCKAYVRMGRAYELIGDNQKAIQTYSQGEQMVSTSKEKQELQKLRGQCQKGSNPLPKTVAKSSGGFNPDDEQFLQFLPPEIQQEARLNPMLLHELKKEMMSEGLFGDQDFGGDMFGEMNHEMFDGMDPQMFGANMNQPIFNGMMPPMFEDEPQEQKSKLKKPVLMLLPLHEAVKEGKIEDIEELLKGNENDIDELDDHGRTPLGWACHLGKTDIVKLLIDRGAKVNPYNPDEEVDTEPAIPLFHAVSSGICDIVEILLEHGADPNIHEPILGHTVMHQAVKSGDLPMIVFLLKKIGPSIANSEDLRGISAFGLACTIKMSDSKKRYEILDIMLGDGVQLDTSVLLDYLSKRDTELCVYFDHKEIPQFSLDFKPPLVNSKGANIMHLACNISDQNAALKITEDIYKQLPQLVNSKDNKGNSPLFYAVRRKHLDLIQFLALNGANINEVDSDGNTVLHLAGDEGEENVWSLLINLGADSTMLNLANKEPKLRKNPGENCTIM